MNFRQFKYVIHDEIAPRLCSEMDQHKVLGTHNITSAGFAKLYFDPEGKLAVECWGESVGLGIKSKGKADAALLTRMFVEPNFF